MALSHAFPMVIAKNTFWELVEDEPKPLRRRCHSWGPRSAGDSDELVSVNLAPFKETESDVESTAPSSGDSSVADSDDLELHGESEAVLLWYMGVLEIAAKDVQAKRAKTCSKHFVRSVANGTNFHVKTCFSKSTGMMGNMERVSIVLKFETDADTPSNDMLVQVRVGDVLRTATFNLQRNRICEIPELELGSVINAHRNPGDKFQIGLEISLLPRGMSHQDAV